MRGSALEEFSLALEDVIRCRFQRFLFASAKNQLFSARRRTFACAGEFPPYLKQLAQTIAGSFASVKIVSNELDVTFLSEASIGNSSWQQPTFRPDARPHPIPDILSEQPILKATPISLSESRKSLLPVPR